MELTLCIPIINTKIEARAQIRTIIAIIFSMLIPSV